MSHPPTGPRRLNQRCQPNFRQQVAPDPRQSCGPYRPLPSSTSTSTSTSSAGDSASGSGGSSSGSAAAAQQGQQQQHARWPTAHAHDTIAMVVVAGGSVAAGRAPLEDRRRGVL